jgi:hypothetical protein
MMYNKMLLEPLIILGLGISSKTIEQDGAVKTRTN